jgi:hypothetical protein
LQLVASTAAASGSRFGAIYMLCDQLTANRGCGQPRPFGSCWVDRAAAASGSRLFLVIVLFALAPSAAAAGPSSRFGGL